MRIRNVGREETIRLQMTPMIDIVFQLLVFFVMTFKIVVPEGDFNIKMPQAAPQKGQPTEDLPPMTVKLRAADDGSLASIRLNERNLGDDFAALRSTIIGLVGDESGPGGEGVTAEIEIDSDYHLRYEYTMGAVTAISGYIDPQSRTVIKLIEKIRFAPPTRPQ
jgi:biopolymer transport protein ExbD